MEYRIPGETVTDFMKDGAMKNQYGIQLFAATDPEKARDLLPPPLELADPKQPMAYAYIVNIREPTFAPWYMEGGWGIMARYGEYVGVYFLGLMLSGPGAQMGAFSGRESSGLPKKLCDRIVVERVGDEGHCFIERGGVRLLDVRTTTGAYNDASFHTDQEGCSPDNPVATGGGCLLHKYSMGGPSGFSRMNLLYYDSPTRFHSWEPARADATVLSSFDDRWGALPIEKVLGAGWMVSDNWVRGLSSIHEYPDEEALPLMGYLLPGRFDRCTVLRHHQRYE